LGERRSMTTIKRFASASFSVPASTAWYLADLGEFKGKQELYAQRSPQRLKALREHAIIESAVSSNRIEGVSIDPDRIRDVLVLPRPLFRDRDEEEVRGYKDALNFIHENPTRLSVNEDTILLFHKIARGDVWDAGKYKAEDSDIIERYADGRERVRFHTVSAQETPERIHALVADWDTCMRDRSLHPLIAMAFFNFDFLCIHPFRDGNGRVSRLLFLLQCYHLGFEAGRYISLERLIEQNKDRYYETLELGSTDWHEEKHNPWPFVNYLFFILKTAYKEFMEREEAISEPRGSKTTAVMGALVRMPSEFTLSELKNACPGVSHDMVRKVLMGQRGKTVECIGKGPGAKWRKLGSTPK
jgi:Fic family protein